MILDSRLITAVSDDTQLIEGSLNHFCRFAARPLIVYDDGWLKTRSFCNSKNHQTHPGAGKHVKTATPTVISGRYEGGAECRDSKLNRAGGGWAHDDLRAAVLLLRYGIMKRQFYRATGTVTQHTVHQTLPNPDFGPQEVSPPSGQAKATPGPSRNAPEPCTSIGQPHKELRDFQYLLV